MSGAYYNDCEPYVVAWLRNLIAAGLIAPGDVDDRSIKDVKPDDLKGYTQCHFFAGIGGWSYALRLAGWNDGKHVWTGSCPCQPLSRAGKRKGHDDERHLWPAFYEIIAECRPATIFGEQVAGPLGREWVAGIRADLEELGFACGIVELCAPCKGAPHNRPRLYWLADADSERRSQGHASAARLGHWRPAEPSSHRSVWDDFQANEGDDGSLRRFGAGAFPLANGISGRVGQLRAYGNAIVPQLAAEFITAFMECSP